MFWLGIDGEKELNMASQAEIQRKNIQEYMKRPLIDPRVVAEMNRQYQYANTIDPEVSKRAAEILNKSK